MNFLRKNWYYVGGGLFIVLAIGLALFWNDMSMLQRLMLMSFMALQAHQFEEYARPGGFPAIMNYAVQPGGDKADRFPLNRMSALFVNWIFAYPFYILPILFPDLIWLGLAVVFFGMAQFGFHGILVNRKMHSVYNPGLFTVVFLFWPIGLYYIWFVVVNGLTQWWIWPVAVVILGAAAFFGIYMPESHFKDENSPYPFDQAEMERFHVREKLEKLSAQ